MSARVVPTQPQMARLLASWQSMVARILARFARMARMGLSMARSQSTHLTRHKEG